MITTQRAIRHLALGLLLASSALADPNTFRERFADPATRALALESLIPGTREHFFHTALDHQLAGRSEEFQKTIAAWKNAAETSNRRISPHGIAQLENRDLLINYEQSPEENLAELIRRLALQFDAARSGDPTVTGKHPTRLDPALIKEQAFEAVAARRNANAPYTAYRGTRILRELDHLDHLDAFDDAKTRWFLSHLKRADHPAATALVLRGLTMENPAPFGSVNLHQQLTAAQLAGLQEQHPPLRSNTAAHIAYLAKSRPGTETDFARDLPAHAAHLAHCRDHALTLPPALNSLKAHILHHHLHLHHHLRLQAELGNYPLEDLLTYLALPRKQHPILRIPNANGQRDNLAAKHPEKAAELQSLLREIHNSKHTAPRLAE